MLLARFDSEGGGSFTGTMSERSAVIRRASSAISGTNRVNKKMKLVTTIKHIAKQNSVTAGILKVDDTANATALATDVSNTDGPARARVLRIILSGFCDSFVVWTSNHVKTSMSSTPKPIPRKGATPYVMAFRFTPKRAVSPMPATTEPHTMQKPATASSTWEYRRLSSAGGQCHHDDIAKIVNAITRMTATMSSRSSIWLASVSICWSESSVMNTSCRFSNSSPDA
mmetsp:Transcript_30847/g.77444  ORF Transcript_30847/g.77444 Transcript_30847/m.77444 type:complete len:227 (-) Transcript_30847:1612-2292(-)